MWKRLVLGDFPVLYDFFFFAICHSMDRSRDHLIQLRLEWNINRVLGIDNWIEDLECSRQLERVSSGK